MKLPVSGTAKNLYVDTNGIISGLIITVSDGTNSLSCTMTTASKCNSGAATAALTAGNMLTVQVTGAGTVRPGACGTPAAPCGAAQIQIAYSFQYSQ
jgi:hypothetical protein